MNAYELADCLGTDGGINDETATMLRQQADRIAELEKENKQLKNILSEIDRQIFNVEIKDDGSMIPIIRMESIKKHPVKQLSDEEIDKVALSNAEGIGRLIYMIQGNVTGGDFKEAVRSFARAIIKEITE